MRVVSNGGRAGTVRPPAAMDDMLYGSSDSVSRGQLSKVVNFSPAVGFLKLSILACQVWKKSILTWVKVGLWSGSCGVGCVFGNFRHFVGWNLEDFFKNIFCTCVQVWLYSFYCIEQFIPWPDCVYRVTFLIIRRAWNSASLHILYARNMWLFKECTYTFNAVQNLEIDLLVKE